MRVLKFGGTSVADAEAIERLVAIVRRESGEDAEVSARTGSPAGLALVVSALGGATDCLLAIADHAQDGRQEQALELVESLRARHLAVVRAVADAGRPGELCEEIDEQFERLCAVVRSCPCCASSHPRSLDAVAAIGELLSSRIVAAALSAQGVPAQWIDPRRLIVTDNTFTSAAPAHARHVRPPRPYSSRRCWRTAGVTGGFVAATPDGITTTLGRGGSDYSASIVGAGIGADEIQIWTDVDGMLTADPRIFPEPQLVPQLSFARGGRARVLRSEGAPSQDDPAGALARDSRAHPQFAASRGPRDTHHGCIRPGPRKACRGVRVQAPCHRRGRDVEPHARSIRDSSASSRCSRSTRPPWTS